MYMYSGEESTHSLTKEISMPYLQNLHWTELCSVTGSCAFHLFHIANGSLSHHGP